MHGIGTSRTPMDMKNKNRARYNIKMNTLSSVLTRKLAAKVRERLDGEQS